MGAILTAMMKTGGRTAGSPRICEERIRGENGAWMIPEKELLNRYAEAFYSLAKLFQQMPCQKERLSDEDLEDIFGQVREQVCSRCERNGECLGNGYFEQCRNWYELLGELEWNGKAGPERTEWLGKQCHNPEKVLQVLTEGYETARINLLWNNRMMEQRMAAGEQIFQTARLLQNVADSFSSVPGLEQKLGKKLRRELHSVGIYLGKIRAFVCEGQRMEIYLSLRAEKSICVSARTVAEILSDCCKERMRPAWNCRGAVLEEPANFHFVPDTKYQIFCGISKITKAGEMVSGDNYAFLQKDTGRVVMSLADGMGSGAGACRESEKVIELLEQFLDAGFPQETAVRMINSCMLLQNQQQMFSTIDLCMVDLYNASCDIIKSGAASTFIRRGDEIEVISSGAFPTGVMQQSDYESMHRQLDSGSTVIMMTDGVLEALPGDGRERLMAELIGKTASRNAREYARRLMEKVYLMQKLQARDDMTILIGNIWEK